MKKRTRQILDILDEQYGTEYRCYLNYETPWQLLIATMLSAQCTDARVNIVTESLFKKYPYAFEFAKAELKELEKENKTRERYYNYYTGQKWGDPQNYDLMINTSRFSPDAAAELILDYIEKRQEA